MEDGISIVKVLRSGKDCSDKKYDVYKVPYDKRKNVMQVLLDIFAGMDRSLAFRRNCCNRGVCGSCTMTINGSIKRACITGMTREMVIEPAGKYELIKDLVVDFSKKSTHEE